MNSKIQNVKQAAMLEFETTGKSVSYMVNYMVLECWAARESVAAGSPYSFAWYVDGAEITEAEAIAHLM